MSLTFCDEGSACQIWKVDTDKVPDVAKAHNIASLPTFKFFKNNEEVSFVLYYLLYYRLYMYSRNLFFYIINCIQYDLAIN